MKKRKGLLKFYALWIATTIILCSCNKDLSRDTAKSALEKLPNYQTTTKLKKSYCNWNIDTLDCLKSNNFITYKRSDRFQGNIYRLEADDGTIHFSDVGPFADVTLLESINKYIYGKAPGNEETTLILGSQIINITGIKFINENTREVEYTVSYNWNELATCFGKNEVLQKTLTGKFVRYDDGWRLQ